jgi:hypothetical protein
MINDTLHDDELYTIFTHTSNFNVALTCKKWYNIIIKKSNICPTCHKITNIGNNILWITDKDDLVCHGYYDTQKKYTLLKKMIRHECNYLQMIKRQSIGLCLYAIVWNYKAFQLIKSYQLTDNIIKNALKINPRCLKYIKTLSYQDYLNAVSINGLCLEHVPEEYQTHELCMIAIKNNSASLQFIHNQTENMCLEAFKHPQWHRYNIQYINIFTEKIAMELFERHGYMLNIEYEIKI